MYSFALDNHKNKKLAPYGVKIELKNSGHKDMMFFQATKMLLRFGLSKVVEKNIVSFNGVNFLSLSLKSSLVEEWSPDFNTLDLYKKISMLPGQSGTELTDAEILISLLLSPLEFNFNSVDSLESHVRVRRHIVEASMQTTLAFKTLAAERPENHWKYDEASGFTLTPESNLIDALIAATQPGPDGKLYDFSCYRASEYIILLAVALESQAYYPVFWKKLEQLNRSFAVKSAQFHEVYLHEYGSMEQPVPPKYYVPGDRLWFKNPDPISSDVTGYEGSWVIYMGNGLFSNFWKSGSPYTLEDKCLEIYHWRDAVYTDQEGQLQMNEEIVEAQVAKTRGNPDDVSRILSIMMKYRDPSGVYENGGCIDTTREFPKSVSADCCEVFLPI